MAASESDVSTEMRFASRITTSMRPSPAFPTTKPSRKKRMIPRIVRMLGVKTPAKEVVVLLSRAGGASILSFQHFG